MTCTEGDPSLDFYVVGGTMAIDAASYIEREADNSLYEALLRGEFTYVLTARQMGKSSLMIRTSARLRSNGVGVVVLDLTAIGQNLSVEQWYAGLLLQLGQRVCLEDELIEFWRSQTLLGPMQRWVKTIRTMLLPKYVGRLVIFIDEIDVVRSLPFPTDEFFAGIRECYNERTEDPEVGRLAFCLLGVAAPSDLVRDTRTTPFNIGRRIELDDFQQSEASGLAAGLGIERAASAKILQRILRWTRGHPYLTQRLCQAASQARLASQAIDVDRLCAELFFSARAHERDSNLLFVRERLLRSEADLTSVLDLYSKVRRGRTVYDDEASPLVNVLRLSGVIRGVRGRLAVRNRIYSRVFDREWIAASMPDLERRRQRAAFRRGVWRTASVSGLLLVLFASLAALALKQSARADGEAKAKQRLLDYTQLKLSPGERGVSASGVEELLTATVYYTQMKLALQEWDNSNVDRVEELLNRGAPQAGDQQRDWRSFEWFWLRSNLHREAQAIHDDNKVLAASFFYANNTLAVGEVSRAKEQGADEYVIKLFESGHYEAPKVITLPAGKGFNLVTFASKAFKVAVNGPESEILLYDVLSGEKTHLRRHKETITRIAFSPDGRYLASGDLKGNIIIWETTTGAVVRSFKADHWVVGIAFAPDNSWLVTTDETSAASRWSITASRLSRRLTLDGERLVKVAFLPDGKRLVIATKHGPIYLVDALTGTTVLKLMGHVREVRTVAVSSDGKYLATGGVDRNILLWDLRRGSLFRKIRGHGSVIETLAWSAEGSSVVSGSLDGTVKVWNVKGETEPVLPVDIATVLAMTFSSDGRILAVGRGTDSTMKLWDASSGRELVTFGKSKEEILCAAFSPRNDLLATGDSGDVVKLWDCATGLLVGTLRGHKGHVEGLAFSPRENLLISGDDSHNLFIWDISSQQLIERLRSDVDNEYRAVFSPDGQIVASARRDGSVLLWDIHSRSIKHVLSGHADQVRAIGFSIDGRRLATGGKDNTVRLWDVETGEQLRSARCDFVQRVAFTPDGLRVVTGGVDGSVKMWDVMTWQELMAMDGHYDEITSVLFSQDGTTLATGATDGTVRIWRAPIGNAWDQTYLKVHQ